MIIEIPKGTPEEEVRKLLRIKKNEKNAALVDKFFGKLPNLKDGVKPQKRFKSSGEPICLIHWFYD